MDVEPDVAVSSEKVTAAAAVKEATFAFYKSRYNSLTQLPGLIIAESVEPIRFMLDVQQMAFIQRCVLACAPVIFGQKWDDHRAEFFHRLGITSLPSHVTWRTERKSGKTTGLAIFLASLLAVQKDAEVMIVGRTRRLQDCLYRRVMEVFSNDKGPTEKHRTMCPRICKFTSGSSPHRPKYHSADSDEVVFISRPGQSMFQVVIETGDDPSVMNRDNN